MVAAVVRRLLLLVFQPCYWCWLAIFISKLFKTVCILRDINVMATVLVNATDAKVVAFVNIGCSLKQNLYVMRACSTSTNTNSSKFEKKKKKKANSQGRFIRETELGLM